MRISHSEQHFQSWLNLRQVRVDVGGEVCVTVVVVVLIAAVLVDTVDITLRMIGRQALPAANDIAWKVLCRRMLQQQSPDPFWCDSVEKRSFYARPMGTLDLCAANTPLLLPFYCPLPDHLIYCFTPFFSIVLLYSLHLQANSHRSV
jgi:hypothetical protein